MPQVIVGKSAEGIVMSADGKTYDFDEQGNLQQVSVEPIVKLSKNCAAIGCGDADAVSICHSLKQFIEDEGVTDVKEVYEAALPFLNSEYERVMERKCNCIPVDPVHHMFFVLAGMNSASSDEPFRAYLIWNKKKLPQLDGDEIGVAFTVPRQIGLETKIAKKIQEKVSMQELHDLIKKEMERLQGIDPDLVSPPLNFASITRNGFSLLE